MRAHIAKIPDGVYAGEAALDSDGIGPDPLDDPPQAEEGRHRPPLRLLEVELAMPRPAQQRHRDHEGGRVPRDQAHLPGRADQRRLLRAAAHRGPARHVPLRAVPASRLRLRGGSQRAHRGERVHDAVGRDSRRPLRRARRHERQPLARRLRPAEGPALHHVRVLRRRVRRPPRGRRADERLLDHRHLEDAADRGAGAALSALVRAVRAARAVGRRGQDARRLRRRLPDPHPPRRGTAVVPDGPRPRGAARPLRRPRRRAERGHRGAGRPHLHVAALVEGRGHSRDVGRPRHVRTPGGGGYGDPLERDPARVRRDVARGYFTAEDAERDYGVVLHGAPLAVDATATARARAARRARR